MTASCIIKSKMKEKITMSVIPEWGRVTAVRSFDGRVTFYFRELTKSAAKEEIERDGLKEAYRDRYGVVYDTHECSFKAMFPGGLTAFEEKSLEELDRH